MKSKIYWLPFVLVCFLMPLVATAQLAGGVCKDLHDEVFGTIDSRLAASFTETDDAVTIEVFAVGPVIFQYVTYAFAVDRDKFRWTDKMLTSTIALQERLDQFGNPVAMKNAIEINPALVPGGSLGKQFVANVGTAYRQSGSSAVFSQYYSHLPTMDVVEVAIADFASPVGITVPAGEILPVFTIYLEKTGTQKGKPIVWEDLGFGASNARIGSGSYAPQWGHAGNSIRYVEFPFEIPECVDPDLFYFRSPSSVETKDPTIIEPGIATLKGYFRRGEESLPPSTNIFSGMRRVPNPDYDPYDPDSDYFYVLDYTGLSDQDSILQRGFIYTTSDVQAGTRPYTNTLVVNGTEYTLPAITNSNGSFTLPGLTGVTFYTVSEINTNHNLGYLDYELNATVTPNSIYYAWAFVQYKFQTSKTYPLLGERIWFATQTLTNNIESVKAGNMLLYPNPTSNLFSLSGLQGNETVRIFDLSGRQLLVRQVASSKETFFAGNLAKGVYLIRIARDDFNTMLKLIVED